MVTTGDSVFVDTNILVYANSLRSPLNSVALHRLEYLYENGVRIFISRQIVREYLVVVSRVASSNFNQSIVAEDVRHYLSRFNVLEDNPATTEQLLVFFEEGMMRGKQIHDANIVASACRTANYALLLDFWRKLSVNYE